MLSPWFWIPVPPGGLDNVTKFGNCLLWYAYVNYKGCYRNSWCCFYLVHTLHWHIGPFHDFSIIISIRWKIHSAFIHVAVQWSLWNLARANSCAVVECANIYSNGVTQKSIFHRIWITMKKSFVKWVPGLRWSWSHRISDTPQPLS